MYTDNSHFQVLFPDNNETLGQALWVRPGGIQGQWHFYVLGRTASGIGAYKEAYMSLTDNCYMHPQIIYESNPGTQHIYIDKNLDSFDDARGYSYTELLSREDMLNLFVLDNDYRCSVTRL